MGTLGWSTGHLHKAHSRHGAALLALTPVWVVKGIPPVSTADAVAALPAVGERSQQHDEKAREHRGSASEVTRTRTLCHTHLRVDGRDTRSREQSEVLGLGVLELRGRREPISAVLAVVRCCRCIHTGQERERQREDKREHVAKLSLTPRPKETDGP